MSPANCAGFFLKKQNLLHATKYCRGPDVCPRITCCLCVSYDISARTQTLIILEQGFSTNGESLSRSLPHHSPPLPRILGFQEGNERLRLLRYWFFYNRLYVIYRVSYLDIWWKRMHGAQKDESHCLREYTERLNGVLSQEFFEQQLLLFSLRKIFYLLELVVRVDTYGFQ